MLTSKEQLSDLKEKYERAEKLVEIESTLDLPTEPFKSHYAGKDILIEMKNNIKNIITSFDEQENSEPYRKYKAILAFVIKDIGRICVWTEELNVGEKHLMDCVQLCESNCLETEFVIPFIGALNQIGILWSNRENAEKSFQFLQKADQTYTEFMRSHTNPLTIYDIFGMPDEVEVGKGMLTLEKIHTLTLYYLAQIVGSLGDMAKSAVYCHLTLKRQLEFNDFEPIDWALNSATLSQYFITNNRFTEARYLLAASTTILTENQLKMYSPEMSDDQKAAILEIYSHRLADVNRCWAKYGLNLLSESKDRLMTDDNDDEQPTKLIKNSQLSDDIKFQNIDVTPIESCISDRYCLMYEDAKAVFLSTINWLQLAQEYYTADTEASEYARIVQDISSAHKYLAFFEDDGGNQCKLHKRRAVALEELLELLNETYYKAICRELWYELGVIYSVMLDIKLDVFDGPNPHALNKINRLCDKSITNLKHFINSYKDNKESMDIPSGCSDQELVTIYFAYFQIGRLYYKIITPDKRMKLNNMQNSLLFYNLFIQNCENNQIASESMKAELGVCKEMVNLLPFKIQQLSIELQQPN